MRKPRVTVVIPTIRNLNFLEYWKDEFSECIGIIIEDHKKKEVKTPTRSFSKVFHYSWVDIDEDLGKKSWIIPRRNAGIRSYGFLKAHELKTDIILTLDDDCFPIGEQDLVNGHIYNLGLAAPDKWFPTYPHRKYMYTRGFPYKIRNKREVVLSHGLWTNVLDFDAPTHLFNLNLTVPTSFPFIEFIPENYFFPMCSMNLAFKTKITALMYFPPMGYDKEGKKWGYDRFDDIWAGIFAKKIIDHLGYTAVNGSPFVNHKKASNVFENLKKESSGIEVNEFFYKNIQKVVLTSRTINGSYEELAKKTRFPKGKYFDSLKSAMSIWAGLLS